jgi:hypothetical protein
MPFIIYIGPPNLSKLKELKVKLNESYKVNIPILNRLKITFPNLK